MERETISRCKFEGLEGFRCIKLTRIKLNGVVWGYEVEDWTGYIMETRVLRSYDWAVKEYSKLVNEYLIEKPFK